MRLHDRNYRFALKEINQRRKNVELNSLLKKGEVEVVRRSDFRDWNYRAELAAFITRLGEQLEEEELAKVFMSEEQVEAEKEEQRQLGVEVLESLESNRGLAASGLSLATQSLCSWLRRSYPLLPEEGVTAVVQHLLSRDMLANISFHIGTRELLQCPNYPPTGEQLATAFLALLGSLPPHRARLLTLELLGSQLWGSEVSSIWEVPGDPARLLVEILGRSGREPPESRLLWSSGPNSILASYTIGIYSGGHLIGESHGESLEIAEEMAHRDALRQLLRLDRMSLTDLHPGTEGEGEEPNPSISEIRVSL